MSIESRYITVKKSLFAEILENNIQNIVCCDSTKDCCPIADNHTCDGSNKYCAEFYINHLDLLERNLEIQKHI